MHKDIRQKERIRITGGTVEITLIGYEKGRAKLIIEGATFVESVYRPPVQSRSTGLTKPVDKA